MLTEKEEPNLIICVALRRHRRRLVSRVRS
jgi:hypothetical protein